MQKLVYLKYFLREKTGPVRMAVILQPILWDQLELLLFIRELSILIQEWDWGFSFRSLACRVLPASTFQTLAIPWQKISFICDLPNLELESDSDRIMADFYQHPNQLIESGISLSVFHTLILDQIFDVRPKAALGYSLGEISMLWANRIWQNAKDRSVIWNKSKLFKDELFGEKKAVRSFWHDKILAEDFWKSYILKVDRELAQAVCAQEEMAFLSIINTPDEVVIVGEGEACQRVIEKLDCRALPMPFNAVIHNPTMQSTYSSFVELLQYSNRPRSDIDFYSASEYQNLVLNETGFSRKYGKYDLQTS